jgi:RNA polymerase sigma-70 factor (ECF subfamily)
VSLSDLYRQHAPGLYRFALRLTGDPAAAEDLVAETFVVAVAGGGPAEPPSACAFLFGTLRNLALHGRRTAARRPAAAAALLDELASPIDLERTTAARHALAAALQDLQALPEETRAALLLRAEGLPYEAVAALLGTSAGAAKVRVHRARVALAARRTTREGDQP